MTLIKICGIKTPLELKAACEAGANMLGFVFYKPSPRSITPQLASNLARQVPTSVRTVGLFVDPDDEWLDEVIGQVPLDFIQLHGRENVSRVAEIAEVWKIPMIKAVGIAEKEDIEQARLYRDIVDWLLLDAKPPENVKSLPGGNGLCFDWALIESADLGNNWLLSGGLSADNVEQAIRMTKAPAVDISSGVEKRRGEKCPHKIQEFIDIVRHMDIKKE